MLISTKVEAVVEVEVELGNNCINMQVEGGGGGDYNVTPLSNLTDSRIASKTNTLSHQIT